MQVPERPTSVSAIVTGLADTFCPLFLWQVLRQLVLLRILDGHLRDLVTTPRAVPLQSRGRHITNGWENTRSRLVNQTVLILHVFRKLGPHADLFTFVVTLRNSFTNRCIGLELARNTSRIHIRRHVDGEVTVRIRLGVVDR